MERDIEVRTIGGESTFVRISPDRRVADLKVLLRSSFPQAMASPSFYLFFKGVRLNLDSCIGSQHIEEGEFIVLVPFTKKIRHLPPQHDPSEQDSQPPPLQTTASSAADCIWLDIMGDISSIKDISQDDLKNVGSIPQTMGEREVILAEKPGKRRKALGSFCTLRDLLYSDAKDIFDQKASTKICQLVESISCLSNPNTGLCLLHEYTGEAPAGANSCSCPLWLKGVLKTFTFINVLYAFFHLQSKCISLDFLKEALEQSKIFGLDDSCTSYVEKLSTICPKVVIILDNQENVVHSQGSSVIIHAFSTGSSDQPILLKELRGE